MGSTPALMGGIKVRMENLAQRQNVISENIANGDTPGYKARTVEEPSFAGLVDRSGGPSVERPRVQISSAMKRLGASDIGGSHIILDPNTSEMKPDGNNVTLEDQVMDMGAVQADFTAMTNLYAKTKDMLSTAVGRGG